MPEFTSDSEYHVWFESMDELKRESDALVARVNEYKWRDLFVEHARNNWQWSGQASLRHALEKVDTGWPELAVLLRQMAEQLKQRVDLGAVEAVAISTRRRKRARRDYGDTLDIHRVWSGELDRAWERPIRHNVLTPSQRYATVYIDLAMSSRYSFNDALWRAAEAMCIVEILTMMGINTEIWSGDSGYSVWSDGPAKFWGGVRIKEYTQPLNDESLAVMASAAFFRTYCFKMMACAPWPVSYAWGYPGQTGMVKPLREREEAGERVFRIGDCLSLDTAAADLKRAITRLEAGSREVA